MGSPESPNRSSIKNIIHLFHGFFEPNEIGQNLLIYTVNHKIKLQPVCLILIFFLQNYSFELTLGAIAMGKSGVKYFL